jgi:hypothetical protein
MNLYAAREALKITKITTKIVGMQKISGTPQINLLYSNLKLVFHDYDLDR